MKDQLGKSTETKEINGSSGLEERERGSELLVGTGFLLGC
jgi:hypothetical protein